MNFGSLFTGVGGFDLALERSGMKLSWQCEIDPYCQTILKKYFNGRLYNDVKEIKRASTERVDLICGGFPCQDLSVAGKRKGLAGERSGLWFEALRVVGEFMPGWVLFENVPGLLSSDEGRDFAIILSGLVELGYGVCWRILDAQYFGVAQRRRRVFIVGSLGNGNSAKVLFEREGMSGDTPQGRKKREEIASPITASTPSRRNSGSNPTEGTMIVSRPLASSGTNDHNDESQQTYIVEQNNKCSTPDMISLRSSRAHPVFTVGALQSRDCKGIGTTIDDKIIAWDRQQITSKTNRSNPKSGKSPTLNSAGKMMMGVRRLTPTECERLQGFPDGWTEGVSDSQRYKQMGNAVAVPVVEWIARRIVACA